MSDHAVTEINIWGFVMWISSTALMWLNQNVNAVVAFTALIGMALSAFGAYVNWRKYQDQKRRNSEHEDG